MEEPQRSQALPTEQRLGGTVLVVDDERNIRRTLRMVLEGEGTTVVEAADGAAALEMLGRDASIEVLLADVKMPGLSGLELLERLSVLGDGRPGLPVILISGHATVSDAVRATRLGAFDFFEKPLERDRVLVSVRNALRQARAERELRALRGRVYGEIVASSPAMHALIKQIAKVGPTKARVLITGESGTGKELVARAIHDSSTRQQQPFVKVNCAAIPRELIESELFGHERGSFTGANAQKRGLFEIANGGTILLDEIGDMDLDAQAKVLRVLQSGELMRVGGQAPIHVDVRVVAATHRVLEDLVASGEFREDLYFRLAVVPLKVPPLRDRVEDIPVLARHFVALACEENGLAPRVIDDAALELLARHSWPGNVRELRNMIERMVVLSEGDLGVEDVPAELLAGAREAPRPRGGALNLPQELESQLAAGVSGLEESGASAASGASGDGSLREVRESVERSYILQKLRESGWNVSRAAELLGLERTHLHRKMRAYNIHRGAP